MGIDSQARLIAEEALAFVTDALMPVTGSIATDLANSQAAEATAVASASAAETAQAAAAAAATDADTRAASAAAAAAAAETAAAQAVAAAAGVTGADAQIQLVPISPIALGAKADVWEFTDGVISAGSLAQITFTNTAWKASAVTIGNAIWVIGAGPGAAVLVTTIAAVNGPTITLATPASQAVAATTGGFGTNDRAAISAAIAKAVSTGIGEVDFGGQGNKYLAGGVMDSGVGYTDLWTYADGSTRPFPRGLIPLPVNAGLHLRGAGAMIMRAPGYVDPGSLFYAPFWLGQTRDITVSGLRLNGNRAAQTYTQVAAAGQAYIWQHGAAVAYGGGIRLKMRYSEIYGWDHGAFGYGLGNTFSYKPYDFLFEHNDFHDNENTGFQVGGGKVRSFDNDYHGNGGLTSLGFDIEVDTSATPMLDIVSIADRFDGTDGLSSVWATVQPKGTFAGLASGSADALAARIHYRRMISIANDDGTPVATAGGRIHIIAPVITQGYIEIYGVDKIQIEKPIIYNVIAEDVSKFALVTGNAIDIIASYAGGVTGFTVVGVTDADIEHSGLSGRGVSISGYERATVTGRVVGGGLCPVWLNGCGGRVDVRVVNGGLVTTQAYWQAQYPSFTADACAALVGMESSAVSVWGIIAPIDITVQASEQRAGAARQLEYAAFLNASGYPVRLSILGDDGLLGETYTEATNGIAAANYLDRGGIGNVQDLSTIGTWAFGTKLKPMGGFEAHGGVFAIDSDVGDLDINLTSPAGTKRAISYFTSGSGGSPVYVGQISQSDDGHFQINIVNDGVAVGTPIQFLADGSIFTSTTWELPIDINGLGYLWVSAAGVLRISATKPTSDADGASVGSQT